MWVAWKNGSRLRDKELRRPLEIFIKKNKIGPGAKLLIVRSGDVIPHIEQILKQGKPDLPNKARAAQPKYNYKGHPEINFEWGDGKNRRSKLEFHHQ